LAKFNRGANLVTLRAITRSTSRCIEVANILNNYFNIDIVSVNLNDLEIDKVTYPSLEITLQYYPAENENKSEYRREEGGFIEFPIYHLLIDTLVYTNGKIEIHQSNGTPIVTIVKHGWEIKCKSSIHRQRTYT